MFRGFCSNTGAADAHPSKPAGQFASKATAEEENHEKIRSIGCIRNGDDSQWMGAVPLLGYASAATGRCHWKPGPERECEGPDQAVRKFKEQPQERAEREFGKRRSIEQPREFRPKPEGVKRFTFGQGGKQFGSGFEFRRPDKPCSSLDSRPCSARISERGLLQQLKAARPYLHPSAARDRKVAAQASRLCEKPRPQGSLHMMIHGNPIAFYMLWRFNPQGLRSYAE